MEWSDLDRPIGDQVAAEPLDMRGAKGTRLADDERPRGRSGGIAKLQAARIANADVLLPQ